MTRLENGSKQPEPIRYLDTRISQVATSLGEVIRGNARYHKLDFGDHTSLVPLSVFSQHFRVPNAQDLSELALEQQIDPDTGMFPYTAEAISYLTWDQKIDPTQYTDDVTYQKLIVDTFTKVQGKPMLFRGDSRHPLGDPLEDGFVIFEEEGFKDVDTSLSFDVALSFSGGDFGSEYSHIIADNGLSYVYGIDASRLSDTGFLYHPEDNDQTVHVTGSIKPEAIIFAMEFASIAQKPYKRFTNVFFNPKYSSSQDL